ncbi:Endonuclease/exonuclease/phosphatase family protein [hydrothermal vent metagenome]|uniref:Endonuclease/exonuclease/phosphatase family protein n=1 Tax=hydrothermal vent metagenome TaxID=652676 RepID=A0A3B1AK09_9ZZZZ
MKSSSNIAINHSNLAETLTPQTISDSKNEINVMSYNVQVGINSARLHHYFTHSWKHVIPHSQRIVNMNHIANIIQQHDIVGLQEVDAGSLRSNFINLTEYLAERSKFPYWYHQVNRNLGRFAQHSNGMVSRIKPAEIHSLKLPGIIPGRRAIMAKFDTTAEPIVFFILHLALTGRARLNQLSYIAERVNDYKHAVVMGDMNCRPSSHEMCMLFKNTSLHEPLEENLTFPSWKPQHNIDHILVTSELKVTNVQVDTQRFSDHLPISLKINLPDSVSLISTDLN